MASFQQIGAGDHGPASSPWTNLPLEVHYVLGSKMDTKGLGIMRLVCTEWQTNLEECISLKVKVDDSISGNLEFVKRVKVVNARIINWTADIGAEPANHLFPYPGWLKKLKLCGKMPVQWKIHNLGQFPNLAHLVLRDGVLYSNNLTGHQFPRINFDLTSQSSPKDVIKQAFKNPPSEAQPIVLQSLQTLEIVRHDDRTELYEHSYLLMMTNMCFILNHLKSSRLSVVHLTMAVDLDDELFGPYKKLDWTLLPLHRFLDTHRTSLCQLLLPNLYATASDLMEHVDLSNSFPNNLRKLMWDIWGPFRDLGRADPVQDTFPYLQSCLQRQTKLQHVHFTFMDFPLKWISDAFSSLANLCGSTLRHLELACCQYNGVGPFDLQILSVCRCLEVLQLQMSSVGGDRTITNADKLPASLQRLLIYCPNDNVEISVPNFFKRFTALEWLYLGNISLLPQDESQQQFFRTVIKGLLGLRELEGFSLVVHELDLNMDPVLVTMLSSLDPELLDQTYSQKSTTFNFNLLWLISDTPQPWSDKPFDTWSWELEKREDGDDNDNLEDVSESSDSGDEEEESDEERSDDEMNA